MRAALALTHPAFSMASTIFARSERSSDSPAARLSAAGAPSGGGEGALASPGQRASTAASAGARATRGELTTPKAADAGWSRPFHRIADRHPSLWQAKSLSSIESLWAMVAVRRTQFSSSLILPGNLQWDRTAIAD